MKKLLSCAVLLLPYLVQASYRSNHYIGEKVEQDTFATRVSSAPELRLKPLNGEYVKTIFSSPINISNPKRSDGGKIKRIKKTLEFAMNKIKSPDDKTTTDDLIEQFLNENDLSIEKLIRKGSAYRTKKIEKIDTWYKGRSQNNHTSSRAAKQIQRKSLSSNSHPADQTLEKDSDLKRAQQAHKVQQRSRMHSNGLSDISRHLIIQNPLLRKEMTKSCPEVTNIFYIE